MFPPKIFQRISFSKIFLLSAVTALFAITATVPLIYRTNQPPGGNGTMDSVDIWVAPDPNNSILFITDKTGDFLEMHDPVTNTYIGRIGGSGSGPGQLDYPNGVAVAYNVETTMGVRDVVFTVERNNNRVSAFALPEKTFLGSFGTAELRKPYGIALYWDGPVLQTWITNTATNPNEVVIYDISAGGNGIVGTYSRKFPTEGILESIVIDPWHQEAYICDEGGPRNIMIYSLDGTLKGRFGNGLFVDDPEGIDLYDMGNGEGWIICSDQNAVPTEFEVFERGTLTYIGHFTGKTRSTDGLTINQRYLPNFPDGSFFPVHSDGFSDAYDWADIASAMGLGIRVIGGPNSVAAPTDLVATAIDTHQIDLTWADNADNEEGYRIDRKTGAGSFTMIADIAANSTSYSDNTLQPGTEYSYRVYAYNADGESGFSNTATATTFAGSNNQPPVAVAEAAPVSGTAPLTVTFTGSNSYDPDGTITSYDWQFGDGGVSAQADPQHTYQNAGTYDAILTVVDNGGESASDTVRIQVDAAGTNQPPTVTIISPPAGVTINLNRTISLSGDATDPEDGAVPAANFEWTADLPNGQTNYLIASGTKTASSTTSLPGTYTVYLRVTDSQGAETVQSVVFDVAAGAANVPPVAYASSSVSSGDAPLSVTFYSDLSADPDGSIASRTWDFGDGASSTAVNPTHTYNSSGTYTVVLTVNDADNASDSATLTITVTGSGSPPNQPPTATITSPADGASFPLGTAISFSGTGTDPEDGTLPAANFTWTTVAPDGVERPLASGVTSGTGTPTAPGNYIIRLQVSDSGGLTDTDEVNITVTPAAKIVEGLQTFDAGVPGEYALFGAYPNPFVLRGQTSVAATRIKFALPEQQSVRLQVYNVLGKVVATVLQDTKLPAGYHTYKWNGRDDRGMALPSGVYLIRITAGPLQQTKKIVLRR